MPTAPPCEYMCSLATLGACDLVAKFSYLDADTSNMPRVCIKATLDLSATSLPSLFQV